MKLPPRLLCVGLLLCSASALRAQNDLVLKSEQDRVAVIEKIKPAVVAVTSGTGSGVLISDDGYCLTNFHVTQAARKPTMKCGLPDGEFYDAVLVGLDKVGDVALIKLLPKKEGQKFPFVVMGDSDAVREGEWSIAAGNPWMISTDFTPTVTFGIISGVHRYQYPAGILLEYTDCLQFDTSINPGNSGGPLFNMKGELIGINGRGSFDKRGRVNSGVGYAISINQIKNFLGHLMAGIDTDHASLGALVQSQTERGGLGRLLFTTVLDESDAARRGVDTEDELLSFAGRPLSGVNQFKNIVGIFPRGWRVPLEIRRENQRKELLIRLMGVQRKAGATAIEMEEPAPPDPMKPNEKPRPQPPVEADGPGAKLFEAKTGYANYYFNKLERDRVLAGHRKHGDFKGLTGTWSIEGDVRLLKARTESKFRLDLADEKEGNSLVPTVTMKIGAFPYAIKPFVTPKEQVRLPVESGGLLPAFFALRQLLTQGADGFGDITHGGIEPIYPPPAEGKTAAPRAANRVDAEVISTRMGGFLTKFYFGRTDNQLLALELRMAENEDPCEVYFGDYRPVEGRLMPHRFVVVYGDTQYGVFTVSNYVLAAAK